MQVSLTWYEWWIYCVWVKVVLFNSILITRSTYISKFIQNCRLLMQKRLKLNKKINPFWKTLLTTKSLILATSFYLWNPYRNIERINIHILHYLAPEPRTTKTRTERLCFSELSSLKRQVFHGSLMEQCTSLSKHI